MSNRYTNNNLGEDDKLVELCKQGDRSAQKEVFVKYSQAMLAICNRYTNSHEDAKDLLQEGFIKVFSNIGKFSGKSTLKTWMTRVFINLAINHLREPRFKFFHKSVDDSEYELSDTTEELNNDDVTTVNVLQELKNLPEKYRAVLTMYAVDNLSHKEIADLLNISESNSKARLSRARVMLQEKLSKK